MKHIQTALIALACFSIISVSALWWMDRADGIEAIEARKAANQAAEWEQMSHDCQKEVALWDSSSTSHADTKRIEFCRWMVR